MPSEGMTNEADVNESPVVRNILEVVGRITVDWNDVDLLWYLIYTCFLHETPRNKVDTIIKQFQTGAAQRKFILALADVSLAGEHRIEIGRLYARTNELAADRNAVVHGDYTIDFLNSPDGLRIVPGGDRGKPNRLSDKPLREELQRIHASIVELVRGLDGFRNWMVTEFLPPEQRTPITLLDQLRRNGVPVHIEE
jgi:hypothetical protein